MTRKWGNSSLVFVNPKEVVESCKIKANQKIKAVFMEGGDSVSNTFGILRKWKKPTDKIMREIDKELWFEEMSKWQKHDLIFSKRVGKPYC